VVFNDVADSVETRNIPREYLVFPLTAIAIWTVAVVYGNKEATVFLEPWLGSSMARITSAAVLVVACIMFGEVINSVETQDASPGYLIFPLLVIITIACLEPWLSHHATRLILVVALVFAVDATPCVVEACDGKGRYEGHGIHHYQIGLIWTQLVVWYTTFPELSDTISSILKNLVWINHACGISLFLHGLINYGPDRMIEYHNKGQSTTVSVVGVSVVCVLASVYVLHDNKNVEYKRVEDRKSEITHKFTT
jgi:hypothetical protein